MQRRYKPAMFISFAPCERSLGAIASLEIRMRLIESVLEEENMHVSERRGGNDRPLEEWIAETE